MTVDNEAVDNEAVDNEAVDNETAVLLPMMFPDPRRADDHGLVAIGGDYSPSRLLAAYASGIFPWPSEELPHAWFSPHPRTVLVPRDLHVSRSLRKTLRRGRFTVRYDTAFDEVLHHCANVPRHREGGGTWLNAELREGLSQLYRLGFAHSAESYRDGRLVGGLYGVALGTCFCGESMFHLETDASKVAFVHLVERLADWNFRLVDCQMQSAHLARLGAVDWPRDRFLDELERALRDPTRRGPWTDEK